MTLEDSDLALPQTLPEIIEAAAASKVSLGFPPLHPQWQCACAFGHPVWSLDGTLELGGVLQGQGWLVTVGLFGP